MLRIQSVEAKVQGADHEALQAKFDDIICNAELKLLYAATDSLCIDVEAHLEAIQEKDIDGTIAQWKTHLVKVKEITSDQVDNVISSNRLLRLW